MNLINVEACAGPLGILNKVKGAEYDIAKRLLIFNGGEHQLDLSDKYDRILIGEQMPMSKRGADWTVFADEVLGHVETYTVPQYGDKGADQVTDFTLEDFKTNMMRYINRMGRNARGTEEAKRDMLKVAHYASMAHELIGESDETEQ